MAWESLLQRPSQAKNPMLALYVVPQARSHLPRALPHPGLPRPLKTLEWLHPGTPLDQERQRTAMQQVLLLVVVQPPGWHLPQTLQDRRRERAQDLR